MSKWSEFIRGEWNGPVIQINNATELHTLQQLAKENQLDYYESFCKWGYKETLHIIKINYGRLNNIPNKIDAEVKFYQSTRGAKSFLVAYQYGKGFCPSDLKAYDESRYDESEWRIYQMKDIINELEGGNKKCKN